MRSNIHLLTRILLLGWLIPITISTIVYKGFSTNYTRYVFSQSGFECLYNNGIYKYRVLGRVILLKTYKIIKQYKLPIMEPRSLRLLDEHGDPEFYSAYFYMNTVFLCLASTILFFVLGGQNNSNFMTVDLPIVSMCLLMGITQYVIVPYDMLSYFFLVLATFLIFYGKHTVWNTLALCFVIILGTLTRETSSLILSFYTAIHYTTIFSKPKAWKLNRTQMELLSIGFAFISTYVGLRYIYLWADKNVIYENLRILENINWFSLLSVMFFASTAIIVCITQSVTKSIFVFYIISLPYTLSILLIAEPWEIRLWTPVILLVLILKVKASQVDEKTKQEFASC